MAVLMTCMQGVAAGAGLAIALAADCRVATRSSQFSAAFVRLGLTGTDMGSSFFLPRVAGLGVAAEMLLTGRQLSAERAYQAGPGAAHCAWVMRCAGQRWGSISVPPAAGALLAVHS